jgi:hypothetical protein
MILNTSMEDNAINNSSDVTAMNINSYESGTGIPYVILGHGLEELDNADNNADMGIKVPPGVTVVTMAECGEHTNYMELDRFSKLFIDPEMQNILSEPAKNLRKLEQRLEKRLHIYKSGDFMPRLVVSYFADFSNANLIYKSGVYKYPTPLYMIPISYGNNTEQPFNENDKISVKLLQLVYKDSVYPPIDLDGRKTYHSFKASVIHRFEDVFDALPKPAVYYHIVCRGAFKGTEHTVYGREPLLNQEFSPGAIDLENLLKLLDLDMDFIKKVKKEGVWKGLDIVEYMDEHPSAVPEELKELFKAIKPNIKNMRNNLEKYKEIDAKLKILFDFPSSLIKDKSLSLLFNSYRNNFKGLLPFNTNISTHISKLIPRIERRRRYSLKQQEKYEKYRYAKDVTATRLRKRRTRKLRSRKEKDKALAYITAFEATKNGR